MGTSRCTSGPLTGGYTATTTTPTTRGSSSTWYSKKTTVATVQARSRSETTTLALGDRVGLPGVEVDSTRPSEAECHAASLGSSLAGGTARPSGRRAVPCRRQPSMRPTSPSQDRGSALPWHHGDARLQPQPRGDFASWPAGSQQPTCSVLLTMAHWPNESACIRPCCSAYRPPTLAASGPDQAQLVRRRLRRGTRARLGSLWLWRCLRANGGGELDTRRGPPSEPPSTPSRRRRTPLGSPPRGWASRRGLQNAAGIHGGQFMSMARLFVEDRESYWATYYDFGRSLSRAPDSSGRSALGRWPSTPRCHSRWPIRPTEATSS